MAFNRAWGLGRGRAARTLLRDASDALGRAPTASAVIVAERRDELAADAAALAAFTGDPAGAVAEAEALGPDDRTPRVAARRGLRPRRGAAGGGPARGRGGPLGRGAWPPSRTSSPASDGRTFATNLHLTRIIGLVEAGRVAEAEEAAEATFRRSASTGFVTGQAVAAWARGRVESVGGRPVRAERWLREARLLERDLQTRGRRRWSLVALGLVLMSQGRHPEAAGVLAELDRLDAEEPADDRFVQADETRLRAAVLVHEGALSAADELLSATAADAASAGATGVAATLWHSLVLTSVAPRLVVDAAGALVEVGPTLDGLVNGCRVADAAAVLRRRPRRSDPGRGDPGRGRGGAPRRGRGPPHRGRRGGGGPAGHGPHRHRAGGPGRGPRRG